LAFIGLTIATAFTAPAFAGILDAKNKADCEKAGGVWVEKDHKSGLRSSKVCDAAFRTSLLRPFLFGFTTDGNKAEAQHKPVARHKRVELRRRGGLRNRRQRIRTGRTDHKPNENPIHTAPDLNNPLSALASSSVAMALPLGWR